MSLKDSALAVLQRNHERNKGATSDKNTMQLNAHLQAEKVALKVLKHEHKAYRKVVASFAEGTYVIKGRRTQFIHFPIKKH